MTLVTGSATAAEPPSAASIAALNGAPESDRASASADALTRATARGQFAARAASPGVQPVHGDFNRDGFGDIALVGGSGWNAVPGAFSFGDGSFRVTNSAVPDLPVYAQQAGAKPVAGDFNKDGYADKVRS
jgi:hypothetical protein